MTPVQPLKILTLEPLERMLAPAHSRLACD
jgi:hypothetical protein